MSDVWNSNGEKSWQVNMGYGDRRTKVIMFAALGILVLLGAVMGMAMTGILDLGSGEDGFIQVLSIIMVLVVLAGILVPMIGLNRSAGRIRLTDGELVFETPKGQKEIPLHELRVSLSKVYTKGYGLLLGSLCSLRRTSTGETVELMASGAELAPGRYNGEDTTAFRFDFSLKPELFQDFVDNLQKSMDHLSSAPAVSVGGPMSSEEKSEQVFTATPSQSGLLLKSALLLFGAWVVLGILVQGLKSVFPGFTRSPVVVVLVSVAGIAAVPLAIFWFLRLNKKKRCYVKISHESIVLFDGDEERFSMSVSRATVSTGRWIPNTGTISYTQGPALRLRNDMGRELTLGIRDPKQADLIGDFVARKVDYVLSADAGRAILEMLSRQGLLE